MGYPSYDPTIARMTAEVREINIEKGWRDEGKSFDEYIALLHSELSEALEAYRDHRLTDATEPVKAIWSEPKKFEPAKSIGRTTPKPEGVGSEFADVLIRLLDTCDVFGIDLQAEYERKVAFNRTRPYQHGGRTVVATH